MNALVTVYDLGGGIGVCLLSTDDGMMVAEAETDPLRVLPQSLRAVRATFVERVEVSEEASAQDHVDRLAQQIARLRRRLAEFPGRDGAEDAELMAQAAALARELDAL